MSLMGNIPNETTLRREPERRRDKAQQTSLFTAGYDAYWEPILTRFITTLLTPYLNNLLILYDRLRIPPRLLRTHE